MQAQYDLAGKSVWVAGHGGMVGAALIRRLQREGCRLLTCTRADVDLRDAALVNDWMAQAQPDAVIIAAAKVGGILANSSYPAEFLYDNLMIEANLIEGSRRQNVEKLLFLGSSCIYPKFAPQPLTEDSLLSGPLEPTNEWYAVAKIAGLKLVEAYRQQYGCDYISAMPTNLYGPQDNFNLSSSHVLPALLRKVHDAKIARSSEVEIWGSGTPLREFLFVDDLADACVFLMKGYSDIGIINVGSESEVTISGLAQEIARTVGWSGSFVYDKSKPDGTPRKRLDVSRLASLGWSAPTSLASGLERTYAWYLAQNSDKDS